ncbi:MAG: ABC transporter substrate-binding protein [Proteobacteria bacterium]|nr:ABC transporter substrate-binding protein [Pseudomonadota bacterium]
MRTSTKAIGLALAMVAGGAAGASAQVNGVTATEVTLGTHTDLSGVAATYGVSSTNGAKMRIEEANAKGIHGRKIKFIIEDAGYQVPKAVQACNKLIHRDKVFAFLVALGTPMNNACFKDQLAANIPNLFPITAARSMYEPFDRLKFYASASYVDQVRSGINYLVKEKGKKAVCVMYQDTDFGKEILEGAKEQTQKLGIKIVETATHKPTDQDFTASLTKLKAANCDLIVMGTIVRDTIIPYTAARKSGWDVTFLGSSATYDVVVGAAPGMDGFYGAGLVEMPYADSKNPAMAKFVADYKSKYNIDPNVGAVYGYIAADLTVQGLENAGKNLTVDSFVKGLESINKSHDKLGGPEVTFGPKIRQGANTSFLAEVKGGRWVPITGPLGF